MSTAIVKIILKQQPPKTVAPEYAQESLLDKITRYIRDVESPLLDSELQWKYLKYIYNILSKKKNLNNDEMDILELVNQLL